MNVILIQPGESFAKPAFLPAGVHRGQVLYVLKQEKKKKSYQL